MANQPDPPSAEFLAELDQAITRTAEIDDILRKLFQKLTKHGIQIAVDINSMMWEMHQGLTLARQSGGEIFSRLTQLQELVHSSALVTTSLELDQVLENVMDTVIQLTGAERAYLMLRDRETGELVTHKARNWDHENLSNDEIGFSRSVVESAVIQGSPVVTTNAQSDDRFRATESVINLGLRSILCIPLVLNREIVGVLYADNRVQQGIFSQSRVALLTTFGTQAAMAIEKARLHQDELARHRIEEELEMGRKIQLSLLPRQSPVAEGWEFATIYQSARLVGGDFYDFFEIHNSSDQLGIVIADVADKGVPAALFMALSRTMIRTTALGGADPSEALKRANTLILKDSQSGLFLTAFYAILDTTTGRVVYSNAGHNRPLWLHSETGQFTALASKGTVLGAFDDISLEDREIITASGDLLVFYTDGVTEAMNVEGELFGEDRLRKVLQTYGDSSAQQVLDALTRSIQDYVGDAPQSDDFTIVVVKRI